MSERYRDLVRRLRDTALDGPGVTDPPLRQAVEARAATLGGRAGGSPGAAIPAALAPFVDTIARHAYRISQDDVDALRRAGYSEDAIFEITASAALGAGLGRAERGLAALEGRV